MGDIIIKEAHTRKELRDFIFLPEKIHKDEPSGFLLSIWMNYTLQ